METIKVDQLPVEMLMEIFKYLPCYKEIALVNKRFYDVVCSVDNSNVTVSFLKNFVKYSHDNHWVSSMLETQRNISKLTVRFGDSDHMYGYDYLPKSTIPDAVRIIKKFSATIKYFHFQHCTLEMSEFLQILSLLPNVKTLQISSVQQSVRIHQRCIRDVRLNLHRVKTLVLNFCCEEFLVLFNRLPADVLNELFIVYYVKIYPLLADLFVQQSKITKLLLLNLKEGETLPDHIFDHLKLETLELWRYSDCKTHAMILSKQPALTSLSLREVEACDNFLNVITSRLTKLKTLNIKVKSAIVPFKKIVNLKNLTDLTLQLCSLTLLETLAGLDNSRITTLKMESVFTRYVDDDSDDEADMQPMPINLISALANSLPNLKVFTFNYSGECEVISAIMQNFNYIDNLQIAFDYDIDAERLAEAIQADPCFNPKLTTLRITNHFVFEEPILTKLIALYPNLKKLFLNSQQPITTTQLKIILNGFKKMESLKLFANCLTAEHLNIIKSYKNNLKSVTLQNCDYKTLPIYIERMFSSVFDVVRYDSFYCTLFLHDKPIVNFS